LQNIIEVCKQIESKTIYRIVLRIYYKLPNKAVDFFVRCSEKSKTLVVEINICIAYFVTLTVVFFTKFSIENTIFLSFLQ